MPQPSTPASAIAQTIATKQRTSNIFDNNTPMRRPSACAADQQTQLFAKNLRAQVPRSPSLSRAHRSSGSLVSQPHSRTQLNYMRETSNSRRRSRNAHSEFDQAQIPQTQMPPTKYSSASRLRSQSPYRSAIPGVLQASTSSLLRRAPCQQGPPLPRGRLPLVSQGPLAGQHKAPCISSCQQRQNAPVTELVHPWQIEKNHMISSPQQRLRQKSESLSNSWTTRDFLKSANNAQLEAEDGTLQLDASDQQALLHFTASFERNGLSRCQGETSTQAMHGIFLDMPTASACTTGNAIQLIDRGAIRKPAGPCFKKDISQFPSFLGGLSQSRSTEEQQQQGMLTYTSQALKQNQQLLHLTRPSVQYQEVLGDFGASGQSDAVVGRGSAGQGVAPSVFGNSIAPTTQFRCEGLRQLLDLGCWCLRFIIVLIVCTYRLLNTSYDSWSSRHFKETFTAMLSSGGLSSVWPASKSTSGSVEGNDANTSLRQQPLLARLSAASIARRSQRQQRSAQHQQRSREQTINQKAGTTLPSLEGSPLTEANTTESAVWSPVVGSKTAETKATETGTPLLRAFAVAGAAFCAVCWFLTSVSKEEFVDFDFM